LLTGTLIVGSYACGLRGIVFGAQTLATFHLKQPDVSPPPWKLPREASPAAVAAYAAGVEALLAHESNPKRGVVAARCAFYGMHMYSLLRSCCGPALVALLQASSFKWHFYAMCFKRHWQSCAVDAVVR
jgi:hypothetical protein